MIQSNLRLDNLIKQFFSCHLECTSTSLDKEKHENPFRMNNFEEGAGGFIKSKLYHFSKIEQSSTCQLRPWHYRFWHAIQIYRLSGIMYLHSLLILFHACSRVFSLFNTFVLCCNKLTTWCSAYICHTFCTSNKRYLNAHLPWSFA